MPDMAKVSPKMSEGGYKIDALEKPKRNIKDKEEESND
jgi:hypothetical protein